MFGAFWGCAFVSLLLLHYRLLPRLGERALHVAPGATHFPEDVAKRYFLFWSASIASFTTIVYTTSAIVWGEGAYLGTLFYLGAPVIWVLNWVTGTTANDAADSEAFDMALSATLVGSLLGTLVGWALSQAL